MQNSTLIPQFDVPEGYMYTIRKINQKKPVFVNAAEVKTYMNECFLAGDTLGDIAETIVQHNDQGAQSFLNILNKPSI